MIFLGETLDRKREVEFDLQDASDSPITSHVFASGEILIRAPGGTLISADVTRIFEIGNGTYVLQLTDAQVAFAGSGVIQIAAALTGAQDLHYPFHVVDPADFGTSGGGGGGGGTALPIGPVKLTDLINIVRLRGDYLSSLTFTVAYLTHEIQAAWAELYELVAETYEGWWDKSSTLPTVAAQGFIGLPVDCWRVQGIDILCGNEYRQLRQIGISQRNRYGASTAQPLAYRLSVRGIELYPTPNAAYTLRVNYTPIVTTLDDTGIQLYGWEEYVITGALLRLDQRSEKPTGERQAELERCKQRVIMAAQRRRQQEPEYLVMREHDECGYGEFD